MRKADYTLLARLISQEKTEALKYNETLARAITLSLEIVAINFANQAHVNFDEFIKECGINK